MDLSLIVPMYNEEDCVEPLYQSLTTVADGLGLNYEILFIDDGSTDRTFQRSRRLAAKDVRLRIIKLRRNYGQTPAMVAGIDAAQGTILITLDGDLQNDPLDIPKLLDRIGDEYDMVVGWRHQRQDDLITRRIPSRIANWLIGKVTGVPIKDNGCSFKAYRANVIKSIPLYSEMHRFIPAIASLAGTRVAQIRVNHHPRTFGQSKYHLSRVYVVLYDLIAIKLILSFVARPLVAFFSLAALAASVGIATAGAGIAHSIVRPDEPSVVLLGMGALYIGLAITIASWGVLAELIFRTGLVKLEALAKLTIDVS